MLGSIVLASLAQQSAAQPEEVRAEASQSSAGASAEVSQQADELYVSASQGYSLRVPKAWERKGKAGADALWEDPQRRSTSVGVTVNPVRVRSIEEFGTVKVVGSRLLEAERKKESTINVTMIRQSSRQAPSASMLYDFEYELDSTRGRKRILNTVTIADSRLYILNATYKCDKPKQEQQVAAVAPAGRVTEEPVACVAAPGSLEALRKVATSFGVLPPGAR